MDTSCEKKAFSTLELAYTALFTVLIAVCSWITVPLPGVPFTLQTFGIFCAMGIIGGKRSFFAVLTYILLGAVGVPVFSGFRGGLGVLTGLTGGYIVGFLASAAVFWLLTKAFGEKLPVVIGAMVCSLAVCYLFGTVWFVIAGTGSITMAGIVGALSKCVIPFIIPDLIKMALALTLTKAVKKFVKI
ncbi:MAG: biotin transporter BioY [Oscillospiraceae bacterium]|nr:biotin transporter BioY [Oscillospiraceae bacterium]